MDRRFVLWAFVGALLVPAAAYCLYWKMWIAPLSFQRNLWEYRQWDDPQHKRHRIADWLISHHKLDGKSEQEVHAMLGPPTGTNYFADWDMVYILGSERGWISIDSEWLVLDLDEAGQVTTYKIVRD